MTTMPSSRKLARKSVSLAMELGMSKAEAARLVLMICDEVTALVWRKAPDMDLTWLAEISAEVIRVREQAGQAAAASQHWSQRVAIWAREFDQGHAPQLEQDLAANRRPGA